jgi:hypothetical protein
MPKMDEMSINEVVDVMEGREGGIEMRIGTRNGGMEQNTDGEIPGEERDGLRMQARQEGPHLRIEGGRIVQRDEQEQAVVD